jgi:site-specific recombinase XerD
MTAEHALISLLALNGLQVSEATGADIEALDVECGHRTLTITRRAARSPPSRWRPGPPEHRPGHRRTARRADLPRTQRTSAGPARRAARIVRRVARRAGIDKPIGPHTLGHAFITAALDAGVSLRDVQEAAFHADPRTAMRYDNSRARGSLDRHATYTVAAYVASAAR